MKVKSIKTFYDADIKKTVIVDEIYEVSDKKGQALILSGLVKEEQDGKVKQRRNKKA